MPLKKSSREELDKLIDAYNGSDERDHITKLFCLQKMNLYLQKNRMNPQLIDWRNDVGKDGFEAHLQAYGIHRDASIFLQGIEFALAIHNHNTEPLQELPSVEDPYQALQQRDAVLEKNYDSSIRQQYIQQNLAIAKRYEENEEVQARALRELEILALCYGKIEAIQGVVTQEFSDYHTAVLGNPKGNNRNFFLHVGDDPTDTINLVIRVEDRVAFGPEQKLQSSSASQYFSEDYASFMMQFRKDGELVFRPVVISEFATQGDLLHYAERLAKKHLSEEEIVQKSQHFFEQLSDFCIKLMASGHYHPDIKLSNFLTDGERIIVSDRKTITSESNPTVKQISSSPTYAAPEYQACLTEEGDLNWAKARKTRLDMPAYMSYQMGMALKEFLFTGLKTTAEGTHFEEWIPMMHDLDSSNDTTKNLSALVQELTRHEPNDRLSIENFQILIRQANVLTHEQFMAEVENLSPHEQLSTQTGVQLLREILSSDESVTPAMEASLSQMIETGSIKQLSQDPRLNIGKLLAEKPKERVMTYLEEVDKLLLAEDMKKVGLATRMLINLGLAEVPRVTRIADLGSNVPEMDDMTQLYVKLSDSSKHRSFPGLSHDQHTLLTEIKTHSATCSQLSQKSPSLSSSTSQSRTTASSRIVNDTIQATEDQIAVSESPNAQGSQQQGDTFARIRAFIKPANKPDPPQVFIDESKANTETLVTHDDTGTLVTRDDTDTLVTHGDEATVAQPSSVNPTIHVKPPTTAELKIKAFLNKPATPTSKKPNVGQSNLELAMASMALNPPQQETENKTEQANSTPTSEKPNEGLSNLELAMASGAVTPPSQKAKEKTETTKSSLKSPKNKPEKIGTTIGRGDAHDGDEEKKTDFNPP